HGFPERSPAHREKIETGNRIAVPGCHATGFHSIVYPLVSGGLMPADYPVVCYSVTGYSGGGKQMIAQYEAPGRAPLLDAPRQYGLAQTHKHLPEMQAVSGLVHPPVFSPILSDYYSGMKVTVPLFPRMLAKPVTVKEVHQYLSDYYGNGGLVRVMPLGYEQTYGGMIPGNYKSGQDDMELWVYGQNDRILVASCFDNLGKGASGAAVQCMNLMLGLDEAEGLQVKGDGKEG
ncbi:MAG: N-acetyl-gamma-glutamyl-phosphate reductase, partial [Clostridiales bacterium]|nr:N-acetyl-gamma-glutamyl-phosphate reductase [Clostridiales bacterium]